jgi:hypothetical protein
MLKGRLQMYRCPKCGAEIEEVKELEVGMSKRDVVMVLGSGLGIGLFLAGAWHSTWWGVAGAFVVIFCVVFLVQALVKRRRSDEVEGVD